MDKCPCCERKFNSITDFPRVLIRDFKKIEMPQELVFPSLASYVGPNSKCGNDRVPEIVSNYFKANKRERLFENEGIVWEFNGPRGDTGTYIKTIKDVRKLIESNLKPHFDQLEALVGQEVPSKTIVPKFGEREFHYGSCRIPGTIYDLSLEELENPMIEDYLRQHKLTIPNLDKQPGDRRIVFTITSSDGGTISEVHSHAIVAGLSYEGRILSTPSGAR